MEKALPLELVAFDLAKAESGDLSNMSAEEYLSWVKHQADSLPLVSRVEIDRTKSSTKPQTKLIHDSILLFSTCPNECLPNVKWERDVLYSFSELQSYISRKNDSKEDKTRKVAVPAMKDSTAWMIFCFGKVDANKLAIEISSGSDTNDFLRKRKREVLQIAGISMNEVNTLNVKDDEIVDANMDANSDADDNNEDNQSEQDNDDVQVHEVVATSSTPVLNQQWTGQENMMPTLDLLLQFDQVLTQKLLGHHIDWLSAAKDLFVCERQGLWLYALLAKLEKPLCRDVAATLRQLFRVCVNQRASLDMSSSSMGTDSSSNNGTNIRSNSNDKLAVLNTIICITGSYFGQGEEYDSRQIVLDKDFTTNEDDDIDDEDEVEDHMQHEYDDEDDNIEYKNCHKQKYELEEGEDAEDSE